MCGLAGFWDRSCRRFEPRIFSMTNALRHRGPDGAGYWFDGRQGLALGHRRLAIIDLSDRGRQPMFSAGGRFAIVYNGEVYNYRELRREIDRQTRGSYPYQGESDTEVILAAVGLWGVKRTLSRLVGMFAFALWDREEEVLFLVRDRLGIKPLYYGVVGQTLLFGSELKALTAFPGFSPTVNRESLASYLRYSAVPAPETIYEGIFKVCPGEMVEVRGPSMGQIRRQRWWRAEEVVQSGREFLFRGDEEQAADALEERLREAVKARMVADVELGAFLSGGIDSSMITALMQSLSSRPVKTFSIGFLNERYNEAQDAELVARHLQTEHRSLIVSPGDVQAVIPRLATLYDEPFADSSQLPTFLVSKLAREEVTVALSGDGGDELFGGYNRHLWGPKLWEAVRRLPLGLRQAACRAAQSLSPVQWNAIFDRLKRGLPPAAQVSMAGDKIHKLAQVAAVGDADELYLYLTSQFKDPQQVMKGDVKGMRPFQWEPPLEDVAQRWMYRDLVGYLPEDILTKVDRASMGVSLEARVPFLDHRVVEFAWRLPQEMKIRQGQGKWILRKVLDRYVPRELVERPKMGFGVPLDAWLRGELKEWAAPLLSEETLEADGFFKPAPIRQMWEQHQRGAMNFAYPLWNLLVFQDWWRHQRGQAAANDRESSPAAEPITPRWRAL